ncbi:hypothetical protein LJC07_01125 [Christensenellaceae bacterium OttesenSCG-928-L17]|nr:hypothetical protein [Christensenellaceae bacterium OttesenSCG-928-L17]
MFASEFVLGRQGAQDALALRERVFVEELGCLREEVFSPEDDNAAHLMVRVGDETVAAGRMTPENDGVRLAFLCVLPTWRRQRFFDLCVRLFLNKAANMGTPHVYITTPEAYTGYFEAFGFLENSRADGLVEMSINPEDVNWHSACKEH